MHDGSNAGHEDATEKMQKSTGYSPKDILEAPVKPPESAQAKKPDDVQKYLLYIGFGIIAAGVVALVFGGWRLALGVAFIGAVCIAVATLVRL